jgi:hypothetical protein
VHHERVFDLQPPSKVASFVEELAMSVTFAPTTHRLLSHGQAMPRPPLRRFRRRRVAVLVFSVAALLGAVRAVAAFGAGPASGTERRPAIHVVQPGETLWSIAGALRPSGDVRGLVRTLARLNGGSSLQVGQRLVLPDDAAQGIG